MASKILRPPGFTLIELLISISIMGFLLVVTLVQYNRYNDRQQVKQAAQTLISNMQKARSDAISGKKPEVAGCTAADPFEGYTVTFSASTYSIAPRCNGVTIASQTVVVSLPDEVVFSPVPSPASFTYYSLTKGVSTPPSEIVLTNQIYTMTLSVDPTSGSVSE